MELNVTIPNSLFERIDDRVDDESFSSRREFVESALEYFLHARERAQYLSQKLPTEMTDRERAEHHAYLSSNRQSEWLRVEPERLKNEPSI